MPSYKMSSYCMEWHQSAPFFSFQTRVATKGEREKAPGKQKKTVSDCFHQNPSLKFSCWIQMKAGNHVFRTRPVAVV